MQIVSCFFVASIKLKAEQNNISARVSALASGDRRDLARAITLIENELPGWDQLLKRIRPADTPVIGFTGPPGAGKSTLINAFLRKLSSLGFKTAVIAVDPTSPFNFGSLLGDRLRMSEHFIDENVFIRSVATRGSLGGLSEKVIEITDLLRASAFDFILVETVGVGQSEVEIAGLADTTIVVVVPESGDDIQTMKSGIMEIADIFVVNKADREGAATLSENLKKMLVHRTPGQWHIPVIQTVATGGDGIDELFSRVKEHRQSASYNQKKLHLLTEKAWKLISGRRMKSLSRESIRKKLDDESSRPGFNLYSFIDEYE